MLRRITLAPRAVFPLPQADQAKRKRDDEVMKLSAGGFEEVREHHHDSLRRHRRRGVLGSGKNPDVTRAHHVQRFIIEKSEEQYSGVIIGERRERVFAPRDVKRDEDDSGDGENRTRSEHRTGRRDRAILRSRSGDKSQNDDDEAQTDQRQPSLYSGLRRTQVSEPEREHRNRAAFGEALDDRPDIWRHLRAEDRDAVEVVAQSAELQRVFNNRLKDSAGTTPRGRSS